MVRWAADESPPQDPSPPEALTTGYLMCCVCIGEAMGHGIKNTDSRIRLGSKLHSTIYRCVTVGTNFSASPSLYFLVYKMGITKVPPHRG